MACLWLSVSIECAGIDTNVRVMRSIPAIAHAAADRKPHSYESAQRHVAKSLSIFALGCVQIGFSLGLQGILYLNSIFYSKDIDIPLISPYVAGQQFCFASL